MTSQRHKCEVHGTASGLPSVPCPAYSTPSPISPGRAPRWVAPIVVPQLTQNVAMASIDMDNYCNGATSYAVTTGTLPTGITLAGATGILSGTPTVVADTTGLVITATGPGGATASAPFTISVAAP